MTWWLYLPMLAYAIPLPAEDVCERTRAIFLAEGHAAQCQTVRPVLTAALPPEVEADLKRLVERGGT